MASVSVIIPAYNEEQHLRDCLSAVLAQSFTDFEIHIIDDVSTDSTAEIAKEFVKAHPTRVTLHQPGKLGAGGARNFAALKSTSPWLAFLDADSSPETQWLEELMRALKAHPEAIACGGPNTPPPNASAFQKSYEAFYAFVSKYLVGRPFDSQEIIEVPHNPSRNVCYRADVFKKWGGFRAEFFPGEDMALDLELRRNNLKLIFNPGAIVHHAGPNDFDEFRRAQYAFGRVQGHFLRTRGCERRLQCLGLLFWIAALSVISLATFISSLYGLILTFCLFLLFSWQPKWPHPLSFAVHSLAWFRGFLTGFALKV